MEICGELKDYLYQSYLTHPLEAVKWLLQGVPQQLNLLSASSQLFPQGSQDPRTHCPSLATFVPYAGDCCYRRKVYHQSSPVSPGNKTLTQTQSTSLMSHLDINYSSHNWNLHCRNVCCHQLSNCLSL